MPVPAPAGGILSFALPRQLLHALLYLLHPCSRKERNQRKGGPDAALILRAEAFERGFPKGLPSPHEKRDASLHRPCGLIRSKPPVLGAA